MLLPNTGYPARCLLSRTWRTGEQGEWHLNLVNPEADEMKNADYVSCPRSECGSEFAHVAFSIRFCFSRAVISIPVASLVSTALLRNAWPAWRIALH